MNIDLHCILAACPASPSQIHPASAPAYALPDPPALLLIPSPIAQPSRNHDRSSAPLALKTSRRTPTHDARPSIALTHIAQDSLTAAFAQPATFVDRVARVFAR